MRPHGSPAVWIPASNVGTGINGFTMVLADGLRIQLGTRNDLSE